MGKMITLKAKDGFELAAYRAEPIGTPKAGLVVAQEIFGLNHHIRNVADRFAAEGYLVIAPALFDRAERGVELGYGPDDIPKGAAIRARVPMDGAMADIEASIKAASEAGKVGVVGYCWGGTLAWAASTRLPGVAASVCYYGGGIASHARRGAQGPDHHALRRTRQAHPADRCRQDPGRVPATLRVRLRRRPRLQLR